MGTEDVLAGAKGALVVPEDESLFAAAVTQVLCEPALRQELSSQALVDAGRWTSRHMAERLLRIYERTIEAENTTRPAPLVSSNGVMP